VCAQPDLEAPTEHVAANADPPAVSSGTALKEVKTSGSKKAKDVSEKKAKDVSETKTKKTPAAEEESDEEGSSDEYEYEVCSPLLFLLFVIVVLFSHQYVWL
jgi:hypothetical protein